MPTKPTRSRSEKKWGLGGLEVGRAVQNNQQLVRLISKTYAHKWRQQHVLIPRINNDYESQSYLNTRSETTTSSAQKKSNSAERSTLQVWSARLCWSFWSCWSPSFRDPRRAASVPATSRRREQRCAAQMAWPTKTAASSSAPSGIIKNLDVPWTSRKMDLAISPYITKLECRLSDSHKCCEIMLYSLNSP